MTVSTYAITTDGVEYEPEKRATCVRNYSLRRALQKALSKLQVKWSSTPKIDSTGG